MTLSILIEQAVASKREMLRSKNGDGGKETPKTGALGVHI
jgi:hypothetical protein